MKFSFSVSQCESYSNAYFIFGKFAQKLFSNVFIHGICPGDVTKHGLGPIS